MEQKEPATTIGTERYDTRIRGTDYIWAVRPYRLDLPFEFAVPHGDYAIEHWADSIGDTPEGLRRDTEWLISNCHCSAILLSKARGRQPEIYVLGLDQLAVIYTVEPEVIVVRGYIRNLPEDLTDDVLAHSYLIDWEWHLEPGCT